MLIVKLAQLRIDEPRSLNIVQAVFDILSLERLEMLDFLFGHRPFEQRAERIHAARRIGSKQRFGEHEGIDELMRMEMSVVIADSAIIVFPGADLFELDPWPATPAFVFAALEDASAHGK